ncbi:MULTISPECIES: hypothetical protein [unclassified Blastococcus]
MYLFAFVGIAWLLTAPAMAVLTGKIIRAGARRTEEDSLFTFLEADLRRGSRRPAA